MPEKNIGKSGARCDKLYNSVLSNYTKLGFSNSGFTCYFQLEYIYILKKKSIVLTKATFIKNIVITVILSNIITI